MPFPRGEEYHTSITRNVRYYSFFFFLITIMQVTVLMFHLSHPDSDEMKRLTAGLLSSAESI